MLLIILAMPLLHAAMLPIDTILDDAEAKQQDNIEEKVDHEYVQGTECSCVAFVRQFRPDVPLINASEQVIATTTPREGAVAIMHYPHSGAWHLALVLAVDGDQLTIRDANYEPCAITERTITLPDRVVGYL